VSRVAAFGSLMRMRVQLLGPVEVFEGHLSLPIGGPKQRTVLAVLCLDPGKPVTADRLIDAVWGDAVPDRASRSVSTFVSNLRRELGDVIASGSGTYAATVDRPQVDACVFEDRARAGEHRAALEVWSGTPFTGVDGHQVLEPEITRLEELRLATLEAALDAEVTAGAPAAVAELNTLVIEHPHRETLRALHMKALYRTGRQADALASYQAYRNIAADLGLDPSPQLQDLELQVLQHDPELAGTSPAPTVTGLPVRYSSFIGRHDEIEDVIARMDDHRLVTLVGPGGIGKTSIATEAAADPRALGGDSVVRIAVESLGEGETTGALAAAMGIDPAPGVDPIDVIAGFVASRPHLVVLDGCEVHINESTGFVDRLLTSTDQIRVLATSREPLGLAGESTIRVDSLDPEDAVALFTERADLRAGFDHETADRVASVCAAVDGVPLAIELAAARVRSIPLDRLVVRLDDQIPLLKRQRSFDKRHGSLAAALDWSYDLLGPDDQEAFRRLSVFRAGFDHRDANALIERGLAEDIVARLVDVSLVQPPDDTGVHRMLEPIRQYGVFLLDRTNELDIAGRYHAEWMVKESRRAARQQWSPEVLEARAWIFSHRFEMLNAVNWALSRNEPDLAVAIIAAVGRRAVNLGLAAMFIDSARAAVGTSSAPPTPDLATAMAHTAFMLENGGDLEGALELLDRAQLIADESGEPAARAEVLHRRASLLAQNTGATEDHLRMVNDAIALIGSVDPAYAGSYLQNKILVLLWLGRLSEAEEVDRKAEAWWRNTTGLPNPLRVGADRLLAEGDMAGAAIHRRESARLQEEHHLLFHAQNSWTAAALTAVYGEDVTAGLEDLANARSISERTGLVVAPEVEARFAVLDDRPNDGLHHAARWFREAKDLISAHRPGGDDVLLYGQADAESQLLTVLFAVAFAFEATGRTDDAAWIAREAPSLMAQTRFRFDDEFGETQRWSDLLERLGGGEPEGVTLEEAFWRVHDMVVADD